MNLLGPEGQAATSELKVTRRTATALLGAVGFAAYVRPVAASAITTSAEGLVIETAEFPVKDTKLPAYVARPKGDGPFPVIIIAHEIFGVHEYIRDTARRFAQEGYYTIVPDLYARAGDPSGMSDFDEILKIVRTADNDQVMSDLSHLVDWLEREKTADTDHIGITGFCWGGNVVWMFSAHDKRVDVGVAWYGRLKARDDVVALEDKPRPYPIDKVGEFNGPVLGLYGGEDRGIPMEDVRAMQAALEKAGASSQIIVYEKAGHGFHADYRPSYNEDAAKDGWMRALNWFRQHGVG